MPRAKPDKARDLEIGQEIARLRDAARLSQDELGAQLGMSSQQISKYERGEASMTVTLWEKLSRLLSDRHGKAGFAEALSSFSPPPVQHPARREIVQIADELEDLLKRLRQVTERL